MVMRSFSACLQWLCASRSRNTVSTVIRASGLELKEVYLELDIDPGTFSKILSDKATFPAGKIDALCSLLRNRIYVEWICSRVGCTAVMLQSEAERRAAAEKARADTAEDRLNFLTSLLKEGGRL
jgi:hypothetical protein